MNKTKELSSLLKMSIPLTAYYLAEVSIGLIDLYIAGQLGSLELSAVGISKSIVFGYLVICFGVLSIVSIYSSESLGKGENNATHNVIQGLWIAVMCSLFGFLLVHFLPNLLLTLNYDPRVIGFVEDYLFSVKWSIIPILFFAVLRNYITVLNKTTIVVWITFFAIASNYYLNNILVFGWFGLPALGVMGAGIATSLVNWISFFIIVIYVGNLRLNQTGKIWRNIFNVDYRLIIEMIKVGIPAGGTKALEGGFFIVISVMMGSLGAHWLAANSIVTSVLEVSYVFALGLGEAASIRIAYYLGKGNVSNVRWVSSKALMLGLFMMAIASAVLWVIPERIVSIFVDIEDSANSETVRVAISLFAIAAFFQIFDGLQVYSTWLLRGLKDTVVPFNISLLGYWVIGLGGGSILCYIFEMDGIGLWIGIAIGLLLTSIFLTLRFYQLLNQSEHRAEVENTGQSWVPNES